MALLEVKDLHTHFLTHDGIVRAVDGVSFTVNSGETLGIVGESGCGKSITALSILRLVPKPGKIVSGEILYQGQNLLKLTAEQILEARWKKIAMIFQDPMTSLNPVMTIGRQIQEPLQLHMAMNADQSKVRAAELLTMVGIPEAKKRLDAYPHQFSGGMRQRVMIAMALSCNPQLLIADEPTTALDVTIQAQIVDLVKRLQSDLGMAVIWITHDLGLLAGFADRMMVMYAGHVVEEASADDLYNAPHHPYTLGLLGSLPQLDETETKRLRSIEGLPPDLIAPPPGCMFEPRCQISIEVCRQKKPVLETRAPGHRSACWVDLTENGSSPFSDITSVSQPEGYAQGGMFQ